MYTSFKGIVDAVKKNPHKRNVAVAGASDLHVLEAVAHAKEQGLVNPILVGDRLRITHLLHELELREEDFQICHCREPEEAGAAAVRLVKEGHADFLMKGMIETKDLLKEIVKKENQLHTGRTMSHFALNEIPGYPKLIVNTDGGMLVYPNLEQKKEIIINTVKTLHALGISSPKIAVLAGIEKVNPKMQETIDAAELKAMNLRGEISECMVEGPISYDLAMCSDIAEIKHYNSPYCGDFDALIVPNLATGNILGKSWSVTAKGKMAGIIVGAKVPIVLTSRGSSAEEKFLSIALASLVADKEVAS